MGNLSQYHIHIFRSLKYTVFISSDLSFWERVGKGKENKMEGTCGCVGTHCGCLSNGNCTCTTCRCGAAAKQTTLEQSSGEVHTYCSCGEHCQCNPCTCSKVDVAVAGKSYCKCGANCQCDTCTCTRADVPMSAVA